MYKITINSSSQTQLIDITDKVLGTLAKGPIKIKEGLCIVFIPHTTAGITINENADPSVKQDLLKAINKAVPFDDNYSHGEGNSAAHIKASLLGASVSVIIKDSHLVLGRWQGIYLCEFDGPRTREIWVKVINSQ